MRHANVNPKFLLTTLCLVCSLMAGCAKPVDRLAADPYEGYNRRMYQINKTLDSVTLKPVAQVYKTVTPKPYRVFVSNFFLNINEIPTIANDLLQGKFKQAASDVLRFSINTTLGLGGLFDLASDMNIPRHQQDLGLTFAKWGYQQSAYVVLPLLGPSTVRDTVSTVGTYYMTPWPYVHARHHKKDIAYGLYVLDTRTGLFDMERLVKSAAVDEYVFVRDAYLQRRAKLIGMPQDSGGRHPAVSVDEDLEGPPL